MSTNKRKLLEVVNSLQDELRNTWFVKEQLTENDLDVDTLTGIEEILQSFARDFHQAAIDSTN